MACFGDGRPNYGDVVAHGYRSCCLFWKCWGEVGRCGDSWVETRDVVTCFGDAGPN